MRLWKFYRLTQVPNDPTAKIDNINMVIRADRKVHQRLDDGEAVLAALVDYDDGSIIRDGRVRGSRAWTAPSPQIADATVPQEPYAALKLGATG